jgi:hypothetical protein
MQHKCRHLTKPFQFWPDPLNSLALLASIRGLIDLWRDRQWNTVIQYRSQVGRSHVDFSSVALIKPFCCNPVSTLYLAQ